MTAPVTEQTEELPSDAPASEGAALETSAPEGSPDVSAPASDTPPAEAAPRETYTDKNGRLREKGSNKFLSAAGTEEAPPVGESVTPDVPEQEATPVAEQPPVDMRPWSFTAEGQTYTLGESVIVPGVGLVVPEPQIDTLHRMLGRVLKSDQVLAQREQMLSHAKEEAAQLVEFNAVAAKQWESLAELVQQGRADEAFNLLVEFATQLPVLKAEAKAQVLERRLTQREEANRPSPQQVYAEARQDAWQTLDGMFAESLRQPWAQGVTPEDHKAVAELIGTLFDRLVVQAPQDIPDAGIARGDWVLDQHAADTLMRRELETRASHRRQLAEATQAQQRAAQQAAAQKARTKESIAAPPTVGGTSGTAAPKAPTSVPKTPEEFQAWFEKTTRGL